PNAPTLTQTGPVCEGEALTISVDQVNPDATYNWTTPTGTATGSTITIAAASLADGGSYSATATVDGCVSGSTSIEVTVNAVPTITTEAAVNVCEGEDIQLGSTASAAGGTFSWTGPNGFSSSDEDPVITGSTFAASGTYTVTVTINGCASTAATQDVTVSPIPSINNTISNPTECNATDGSITITGLTAGESYDVSYNGSVQLTGQTADASGNIVINNLGAGNYTNISVSNAAGCSSNIINIVTLSNPNAPNAPTLTQTGSVCEGEALTISVDPVNPDATYN